MISWWCCSLNYFANHFPASVTCENKKLPILTDSKLSLDFGSGKSSNIWTTQKIKHKFFVFSWYNDQILKLQCSQQRKNNSPIYGTKWHRTLERWHILCMANTRRILLPYAVLFRKTVHLTHRCSIFISSSKCHFFIYVSLNVHLKL